MTEQSLDFLAATDETLSLFDTVEPGAYFGVELMRRGMQRQRERLLLDRLGSAPRFEQALELELRQSNTEAGAEAALLANVLGSLQEAILAVAQSLRERPTLHGPVTAAIQDAVRLRVAFALPGSLRLRLIPADPESQHSLFEEEEEESLLSLSMSSLLEVLESATRENREDLLQHVASLGPRASLHLGALSSALDRGNARMAIAWRSPRAVNTVRLDRSDAQRLNSILQEVRSAERELVVSGRLVGGSLVRRTFEIELDDGSILSGKADEQVLPVIEELFGGACTAELLETETSLPSGETKEAFRLVRLTA